MRLKQVAININSNKWQNLLNEEINPDLPFAKFQKADNVFADDRIILLILLSSFYHLFVLDIFLDSKYVKN